MISRRFSRIFWKEYRTQRNVWLALLYGAILLQGLFLLFSRQEWRDMLAYPFVVAGTISICYFVASAAILFAGEREAESDVCLQTLPVGPWTVLTGKLAYTITSGALLLLLTHLMALLIMQPNGVWIQLREKLFAQGDIINWCIKIPIFAILGALATSLVSLRVQRVMTALAGGILLSVFVIALAGSLEGSSRGHVLSGRVPFELTVTTAFLIVLLSIGSEIHGWLKSSGSRTRNVFWPPLPESALSPQQWNNRRYMIALIGPLLAFLIIALLFPPLRFASVADINRTYILVAGSVIGASLLITALCCIIRIPYVALATILACSWLVCGGIYTALFATSVFLTLALRRKWVAVVVSYVLAYWMMTIASLNDGPLIVVSPAWKPLFLIWTASAVVLSFLLSWRRLQFPRKFQPAPRPLPGERSQTKPWRMLQRALIWGANRPTPRARLNSVLIWKELRSARPAFLCAVAACVVSILFILYASLESNSRTIWSDATPLFLWITFIYLQAAAILMYSGDHRHKNFRFLTDRGIEPGKIWWIKQLVWGGSVGLIASLCIGIISFTDGFLSRDFEYFTQQFPALVEQDDVNTAWSVISILISVVALSFAVQQLISLWSRSVVMSTALGWIAFMTILPVHFASLRLAVPLSLSTFPITAGFLAASYFTFEAVLKETRSWQQIWARSAWIAMPIFIATVGTCIWREVQIPIVEPPFDWQAHEKEMNDFDPAWTADWEALIVDHQLPTAQRAALEPPFEERFLQLAERITEDKRISPELMFDERPLFHLIEDALDAYSSHGLKETASEPPDLDLQRRRLNSVNRTLCYFSQQSLRLDTYGRYSQVNSGVLKQLRHLIQDPRQTEKSLEGIVADFPGMVFHDIENDYVLQRQIYEQRSWGWEWAQENRPETALFLGSFPTNLLVTERARLLRLLNWSSVNQTMNIDNIKEPLLQMDRLFYESTPLADKSLSIIGYRNNDYSFQRQYRDWGVSYVLANLERYRLKNGEYPRELSQILTMNRWGLLSGPLKDLEYLPQGLSKPLLVSSDYLLPANQPVMYFDHFSQPTLQILTSPIKSDEDRANLQAEADGPELISFLEDDQKGIYTDSLNSWHYRNPTQTGTERDLTIIDLIRNIPPKTDQIIYIEFGQANPKHKESQ